MTIYPAMLAIIALILGSSGEMARAQGVDKARVETLFQVFLKEDVSSAAAKAGVSLTTVNAATAGLTLDWSLPDLAPPGAPPLAGPQRQPEFADPGRYVAEPNFAALT